MNYAIINSQNFINILFIVLFLVLIFLLIQIVRSQKIKLLPSFINKNNLFFKVILKRKTLILSVFIIFVILVFGSTATTLAFSLKAKSDGNIEYKKMNYQQALDDYNKAENFWFIDRINLGLRDRDLYSKLRSTRAMVQSTENYQKGKAAYDNKQYRDAKNYFALMAQNDPRKDEVKGFISNINVELEKQTVIAKKQTQNSVTQNTKTSVVFSIPPNPAKYAYLEFYRQYVSQSGMSVTITGINKNEESGFNTYTVHFVQENKTVDKKLTQGSFTLIFEDGTRQNQYGIFGYLYPGERNESTASIQILKTQKPYAIEFDDWSDPITQETLKWRVTN